MRSYKVISKYAVRDADGTPTGRYKDVGDIVSLDSTEAERLISSGCIQPMKEEVKPTPEIVIETAIAEPAPEKRIFGRRGRPRRQ